jgi:hypothetical protein
VCFFHGARLSSLSTALIQTVCGPSSRSVNMTSLAVPEPQSLLLNKESTAHWKIAYSLVLHFSLTLLPDTRSVFSSSVTIGGFVSERKAKSLSACPTRWFRTYFFSLQKILIYDNTCWREWCRKEVKRGPWVNLPEIH